MFVEMICQTTGGAKFVVAQTRFVLFGSVVKSSVTLLFVFRLMLDTSGVTTVSMTTLLVTLP